MPLSARTGRRWRASIRAAGMAVVAAQLFQAAPSFASSFQVNPVKLSLSPDKATTSLSIGNDTGDEVGIRVSALRWTQEIGRAHVRTTVTNAHTVCRILLENKNKKTNKK